MLCLISAYSFAQSIEIVHTTKVQEPVLGVKSLSDEFLNQTIDKIPRGTILLPIINPEVNQKPELIPGNITKYYIQYKTNEGVRFCTFKISKENSATSIIIGKRPLQVTNTQTYTVIENGKKHIKSTIHLLHDSSSQASVQSVECSSNMTIGEFQHIISPLYSLEIINDGAI